MTAYRKDTAHLPPIAAALVEARIAADLSQTQLGARMRARARLHRTNVRPVRGGIGVEAGAATCVSCEESDGHVCALSGRRRP